MLGSGIFDQLFGLKWKRSCVYNSEHRSASAPRGDVHYLVAARSVARGEHVLHSYMSIFYMPIFFRVAAGTMINLKNTIILFLVPSFQLSGRGQ